MRIHHLNCISACPLGGVLMDGFSRSARARLTCHCLLLELPDRLVLVDTGYGLRDVANPSSRLNSFFLFMMSPDFREEMTAFRQIEALRLDPRAVNDVILTHLDFDHAGGLDDFPQARVHMLGAEIGTATARRTVLDRMRYRPQQWSTRRNWLPYAAGGERWRGFECVRGMRNVPPEILLIPMRGHTLGHAAVAVDTGTGWLLYAGDAYFYHGEMNNRPRCTPGLRFYQWMMEKDRAARLGNQERLRSLKSRDPQIQLFCAHDPREFEELAQRQEAVPARAQPMRTDHGQRQAGFSPGAG